MEMKSLGVMNGDGFARRTKYVGSINKLGRNNTIKVLK
jgi:hypothetical protein